MIWAIAIAVAAPHLLDGAGPPVPSPTVHVATDPTNFIAKASQGEPGTPGTPPSAAQATAPARPPGHWVTVSMCMVSGNHICPASQLCPDGTPMIHTYYLQDDGTATDDGYTCHTDGGPPQPGDILAAFQRIPMDPSPLTIQPPGGQTLVNFDTIYYTRPTTIDKTVTVLGTSVDFHITVASYTWHFGDGASTTTTDPGAAYPHQTITHRYARKGPATPSLDTTYQADYRIDGGAWQHLAQTVTIAGPRQQVTVRTATPHLVGD